MGGGTVQPGSLESPKTARRPRQAGLSILYGEADSLTIEGFRAVVGNWHRVVGTARDGLELVDLAIRLKPNLVVLAITIPRLNGIDATRIIKARLKNAKVLVLTRHDSPRYVQAALAAGADGYVLKSEAPECVLEAIDKIMDGRLYVPPKFRAGYLPQQRAGDSAGGFQLTARERQILQQIAEGHSAKQIAGGLRISIKTVSFHRENIKRKLGVRTTADLTRQAMELGLVPQPESEPGDLSASTIPGYGEPST